MFSQACVIPPVHGRGGLHQWRGLPRGVCLGFCIQGGLPWGSASRGSASGGRVGLHPGGVRLDWSASGRVKSASWGVCIRRGLHPGGSASRGVSIQRGWADPPLETIGYGQLAGGMHLTGMHSCFLDAPKSFCSCYREYIGTKMRRMKITLLVEVTNSFL